MKTNKKGISLIVLIITILVMIILAAVVLLYLDDSKMIRNAKKAVTANDVSAAKEVVAVARAEWRTDKERIKEEGYETFKRYAEVKLEENGYTIGKNGGQVEVNESGILYAYVNPIIPEGFVASQVDTEDEVIEGLVIYEGYEDVTEDNVDEAQETRNQYVWVPVPNVADFQRIDWGKGSVVVDNIKSYKLEDVEETAQYSAMRESVMKYGGFYIARYETGKGDADTPVSKRWADVYNSINWTDAKTKAATLTSGIVVSHLIYGEEWCAALDFMSEKDPTYVINSSGKGNYTTSLVQTGIDDDYAVNNIFDIAGNVEELTMEYYTYVSNMGDIRIIRGGSHATMNGSTYPASFVNTRPANATSSSAGFRVALYIK